MNPENKDLQTSNQNSSNNIIPTKERLSIQPPSENAASTSTQQPIVQPDNVPATGQANEAATPPPVSAPVVSASPVGQSSITPDQSFITSQPLLSKTDIEAKVNKARRKRLMLLSGSIFALIVVVGIVAALLGLFTSFKTITYDNGEGSKYSMTFYAKYHEENLAYGLENQLSVDDITSDDSSKKLVSKVSKEGKAPITFAILSGKISSATQAGAFSKIRDCTGGLSESLSVHNKSLDRDIKLCSVKTQDGIEYAYMGAFETKDKFNFIQIAHDLNYKDLQNSGDKNKLVGSLGIDTYKDDIQQIVGSITPLD